MPSRSPDIQRRNLAAPRGMELDIVSYGRRGPGGRLRLGKDQIEQIQRTVGRVPEVLVKVSGGGRDIGTVQAHLRYIGRHGKLAIETDDGAREQSKDSAKEITYDWQLDLCRSQHRVRPVAGQKDGRPKLVHNIVLSMPAGTPPDKLLAAVKVFARENFALQYRYAMVLHTDQPHPHVHLVVKCEHEFELGRRLNIRKATLRHWREQFASLMREQGVAANATTRQIRGQVRQPLRDPIHHRLRDIRAFSLASVSDGLLRKVPKTSNFMKAKLQRLLRLLKQGQLPEESGKEGMRATRREVIRDWQTSAQALRQQGEANLAARVDRFVAQLPPVQTDAERMAARWEVLQERPRTPEPPLSPRHWSRSGPTR